MKMQCDSRALIPTLILGVAISLEGTTLTVTNTADNGAGTLREAIANANNGDTIDATGLSGTILLTTGELLITNSISIKGPGPANLAIDGNYPNRTNRVFQILTNPMVSISGLTITNGNASSGSGGGIRSFRSSLTVSNCTISGNSASGGGGIYSGAIFSGTSSLTIINSTISSNSAVVGGGIYNQAQAATASLVLVGSTVCSNVAGSAGGGGIKNQGTADPTSFTTAFVTNSAIADNSTTGNGGGFLNDGLQGSAALVIVSSTLMHNSADLAGGSVGGGGIFNNDGGAGGTSAVTVVNCTLSENSTGARGGGIRNGFGISLGITTLALLSSTLNSNSAPALGGGVYNVGLVQIGNTILNADSSSSNLSGAVSGKVISFGYNLSSDSGGGFLTNSTDRIDLNPLLGPLQDNGGPVFTHALLPGSPAIDQGKNLSGSSTDARGSLRTFDEPAIINAAGADGTDIGAYEAFEFRITAVEKSGDDLQIKFISLPGMSYHVQTRTNLASATWSSIGSTIPGNGGVAEAVVTNAFVLPQQFYRIHQLP